MRKISHVGHVSRCEGRLEWRIPHFFSHARDAQSVCLQSPVFLLYARKWTFQMWIPVRHEYRHRAVRLALKFRDFDGEGETPVSFTSGLKTSEGGFVQGDTETEVLSEMESPLYSAVAELRFTDLESHEILFLPSGTLTFTSDIRIGSESPAGEAGRPKQASFEHLSRLRFRYRRRIGTRDTKGHVKLAEDLKDLLLNELDSDVIFKVGGKEFKAHRLIARVRSPVLFAMFAHDTEERRTGVVHIEDCDPDTFPDFLSYVYTGRVEALTEQKALHLYRTADKYQVMELKEQCLELLKTSICIDNFCDVLALSLQHNERELTEIATQFFVDNSLEIVQTPIWQTFLKENPTTANELIIKGFQKIQK